MKHLSPYITFDGNCEEALNFYHTVFGGTMEIMRYSEAPVDQKPEWANKVMHATFKADDFMFMASDGMGEYKAQQGNQIHLLVDFPDEKSEEQVYNMLSKGGNITQALQDTFWGAKFAMLTDKFGISWMLNYSKGQ